MCEGLCSTRSQGKVLKTDNSSFARTCRSRRKTNTIDQKLHCTLFEYRFVVTNFKKGVVSLRDESLFEVIDG